MSSLIFIRIWHKNNKKLQFTSTKSQRVKTSLLEKDLQVFIFERVNAVNTPLLRLRHPAHVAHVAQVAQVAHPERYGFYINL
jgi:hypothetical protein